MIPFRTVKGYFITFEGVEGGGKTTQMALLARDLKKKYAVVQTREPGGTKIGSRLRALVLGAQQGPIAPKTELFLYLADRAQHLKDVIEPALQNRKIVLCDRFTDSTLVYQGYARGLSLSVLQPLLNFAANALVPDLTFVLDMDVQQGLARLQTRREINRLDRETLMFHRKVRRGYRTLAKNHPERIRLIRADRPCEAVFAAIKKEIDAFLP